MSLYNPTADGGIDFFERIEYGEQAAEPELYERYIVAIRLLNCHRDLVQLGTRPLPSELLGIVAAETMNSMLINEACGHILESLAVILHLDSWQVAKEQLLDITPTERNARVWNFVKKARPLQEGVRA